MKTHLPHAEEIPLILGSNGLVLVADALNKTAMYLLGGRMPPNLHLSEKFDGAPAVCIGLDHKGLWVGTKSALRSNDPRRYHSADDIWRDRQLEPPLASKLDNLLAALMHFAPKTLGLNKRVILCGDLSHARGPLDQTVPEYVRPNVLAYRSLDRLHERASVGLILHTIRNANTQEIISTDPNISLHSDHLSILSAGLPPTIPTQDRKTFYRLGHCAVDISSILNAENDVKFLLDDISQDEFLKTTLLKFFNRVKLPKSNREKTRELRENFQVASEERIEKLKTVSGKERARRKDSERLEKFTFKRTMSLLKTLQQITRVKESLVSMLPRPLGFSCAYENDSGVHLIDGEGFVLHLPALSLKLVKRDEFSLVNRCSTTKRGFEL